MGLGFRVWGFGGLSETSKALRDFRLRAPFELIKGATRVLRGLGFFFQVLGVQGLGFYCLGVGDS